MAPGAITPAAVALRPGAGSTDASNFAAAKDWLTAHPIDGLEFTGTSQGSSGSSISETPLQNEDDSVSFEFVPSSTTVTIMVDVVIVPAGAGCVSSGGGGGATSRGTSP